MKRFKSVGELADALASGEIPREVLSPGGVASALGISRQAVHQRLQRGTLRGWTADGVILIDVRDVRLAKSEKRTLAKLAQRRRERGNAATSGVFSR